MLVMGKASLQLAVAVACLLIALVASQEEQSPIKFIIRSGTFKVEESDGTVAKEAELTPPGAAKGIFKLDHTQTLKVGFIVESESGELLRPQQAVVRLTSAQSGAAAYFAATRNKDGSLSANIKSLGLEKQLDTQGGVFEVALIVGDTRAAAPLEWHMGQMLVLHVPLDDGTQPAGPAPRALEELTRPKPEIVHMHRPPHKPIPAGVALAFSGLCAAPLGLFLLLVVRMGANLKGFPSGPAALWALLFHAGLGSILVLYLIFWIKLNLMQTLPLAVALGLVTAGFGNRALSSLVQSRQKAD